MDGPRFDDLARSLTIARPRRGVVRLLGGFALGGFSALGASSAGAKRGGKKRRAKTTICHQGRTLRVGKRGLKRHREHGDRVGPCPEDPCDACRPDQLCEDGACRDCKGLEVACTDGAECCSGICDVYFDTCQAVRFGCDPTIPGHCPNRGICCQTPSSVGEFVCIDDPSSNSRACGAGCDSIENCRFGSVCQSGRCCCPPGQMCADMVRPCEM